MDYAITGTIFTLVVFVFFIGIVLWAFSKKAKTRFDEAQNLVFDDEPQQQKRESEINE
jgi:cytochrome c oxidase cbb3-type subunit 4